MLADLEKRLGFNSIGFTSENRAHTGLLCLDLMMGGGVAPGMYVFFGPEQSAKTTAAITIMGATSADPEIKLKVLWDAEGSSGNSLDYIANIFETQGYKTSVDELFGVKNSKGSWITPPKVYYRDESNGDDFYNWVYGLGKRIPDKRFADEAWWYIYEDTKENKARLGSNVSKRQSSGKEGLWVPAVDGSLQAIIILDSLPSLVPAAMDEDEGSNAMAVQARMNSKHLPRIKGFMRSKRIAFIAINQLRLNPGARFSNPEYSPGGEAIKFFSDVRFRFFPRSLSGVPFNPKGEGQIEREPSISGEGEDTYRYLHVGMQKNKLSSHVKEMWMRLWVADENGEGRGYDPVWDCFWYGVVTGQIAGKREAIQLNVKGLAAGAKTLKWAEFKMLVLGSKKDRAPIFEKLGMKNVNLRAGFRNQIESGSGLDMYFAVKKDVGDAEKAAKSSAKKTTKIIEE
jgi:RecA/RadA recombinase